MRDYEKMGMAGMLLAIIFSTTLGDNNMFFDLLAMIIFAMGYYSYKKGI